MRIDDLPVSTPGFLYQDHRQGDVVKRQALVAALLVEHREVDVVAHDQQLDVVACIRRRVFHLDAIECFSVECLHAVVEKDICPDACLIKQAILDFLDLGLQVGGYVCDPNGSVEVALTLRDSLPIVQLPC